MPDGAQNTLTSLYPSNATIVLSPATRQTARILSHDLKSSQLRAMSPHEHDDAVEMFDIDAHATICYGL